MASEAFEHWLVEVTERAFLPLTTRAQIWDYGARLKFKVLLPGPHKPYEFEHVLVEDALQRHYLESVLETARREIRAKGLTLDPWETPRLPLLTYASIPP